MPSILTSLELLKSVYDSLKGGVDVEFVLLLSTGSDDIANSASKASITGISAGRGLC